MKPVVKDRDTVLRRWAHSIQVPEFADDPFPPESAPQSLDALRTTVLEVEGAHSGLRSRDGAHLNHAKVVRAAQRFGDEGGSWEFLDLLRRALDACHDDVVRYHLGTVTHEPSSVS